MSDDDHYWGPPTRPIIVYRLYDVAAVLLYVGISAEPSQRMNGHRDSSAWWAYVAHEETTEVWFKSKAHALSAEARAIATEHPVHNVQPGRIIPHLGGPDAILTEEEARRARRIWLIRDMHTMGVSAELMTKMPGFSRAEIDQALGEAS